MHQGCASLPKTGHHWRRLGLRCHGVGRFSVSNLSARLPATLCAAGRRLDPSVPTSWDDVVRSMVLESSVWGPHSLHTAEVTGSIPVTPTSQNTSQGRSRGPLARRFARYRGLGVLQSRSAWLGPSCRRVNGQLRLVVSRLVQLASLEHPISPVEFGWGDRLGDLEGEGQPLVERLDDSGGHLRGGVPVAGADAAATLQLPVAAALVTHQLIDHPGGDALVLQPGRKLCRRSWGPRSRRCARSFRARWVACW